MKLWWFPDNTVLCNFASVGRLDVLEKTLASQGRWVEAVAYEAHQSAAVLPALRAVLNDGWLGEPIEITGDNAVHAVDVLRRMVFGGHATDPRKHLGEAQTLYLLQNRTEFRGSIWITDDRDAYEYAQRQGILTRDTVAMMRHAVADAMISADEGFGLLHGMLAADRSLRSMPSRAADLLR